MGTILVEQHYLVMGMYDGTRNKWGMCDMTDKDVDTWTM